MTATLHAVELRHEHDVVLARQRSRQIGALLGLDRQETTRLATAVSEVARNAFEYAGGGRAEFLVGGDDGSRELQVRIRDGGPGIADVRAVLDGHYRSRTGLGLGIVGARRLVDTFDISTQPGQGTTVVLGKKLPATVPIPEPAAVADALAKTKPDAPFDELQRQNQELLSALGDLRDRQREIERLNVELEETNRGVLALYTELDERAIFLTRINELKTTFLSELSHELRTPLNAIRNVARFLLDEYEGPLTQGQAKGIQMMDKSATSLTEFVDDWLDLAKIDAGRIELHPTEFTVESLFGALRGVFRPMATSPDVELSFDYEDALPPLFTDEGKVAQILRNFISNALKFTERGEVRVSARLEEREFVFEVSDTGIGVAAEDQTRIFEEFTQVNSPAQRRVKGTGLGLPLSRKLARLLGGDISMFSRQPVGSVFLFRVPQRIPDKALEISGEHRARVDAAT